MLSGQPSSVNVTAIVFCRTPRPFDTIHYTYRTGPRTTGGGRGRGGAANAAPAALPRRTLGYEYDLRTVAVRYIHTPPPPAPRRAERGTERKPINNRGRTRAALR